MPRQSSVEILSDTGNISQTITDMCPLKHTGMNSANNTYHQLPSKITEITTDK